MNTGPPFEHLISVAADFCAVLHLWPQGVKPLFNTARRYLDRHTPISLKSTKRLTMRTALAEKIMVQGIAKRYDGKIVEHLLESIDGKSKKSATQLTFNSLVKSEF